MQTVNTDNHLSDDILDQYRAGLLDDSPQILQPLREHLAHCASCRQRAQTWERLQPTAPDSMAQDFAAQRDQVFKKPAPRRSWTMPALAIAASVFFALIGINVFTTTAPPQPVTTPHTQVARDNNAELFTDIDFYIWLSQHQDAHKQNEGNT